MNVELVYRQIALLEFSHDSLTLFFVITMDLECHFARVPLFDETDFHVIAKDPMLT